MLPTCQSPIEIITVLIEITQKLTKLCPTPPAADEIIPLLSYCVHGSVLLGEIGAYHGDLCPEYTVFSSDLQYIYNMIKIAEVFIPDHLSIREDAYVITILASAIYTIE